MKKIKTLVILTVLLAGFICMSGSASALADGTWVPLGFNLGDIDPYFYPDLTTPIEELDEGEMEID